MILSTKLTTLGTAVAVTVATFAISVPNRDAVTFIPRAQAQQSQPSATTVAAAGITLHSVSVDLPASDRMFPGGGDAEAINNNCLACHSAGMVLNQPDLTRSAWERIVDKMRSQYKAPVADEDVPAIVAYLASHKGAQ
jgi:hypothetical protein